MVAHPGRPDGSLLKDPVETHRFSSPAAVRATARNGVGTSGMWGGRSRAQPGLTPRPVQTVFSPRAFTVAGSSHISTITDCDPGRRVASKQAANCTGVRSPVPSPRVLLPAGPHGRAWRSGPRPGCYGSARRRRGGARALEGPVAVRLRLDHGAPVSGRLRVAERLPLLCTAARLRPDTGRRSAALAGVSLLRDASVTSVPTAAHPSVPSGAIRLENETY